MSATTPEAKTKRKIRNVIDNYRSRNISIYVFMPVPGGFGAPTLDYLGCVNGMFFAIEAKRPGGKPTLRQLGTIQMLQAAGAAVFVISDDESLGVFERWLERASAAGSDQAA